MAARRYRRDRLCAFSPLWTEVGAAHVIVLADSVADGETACRRGASGWLPADCPPETLMLAVTGLHDLCTDPRVS